MGELFNVIFLDKNCIQNVFGWYFSIKLDLIIANLKSLIKPNSMVDSFSVFVKKNYFGGDLLNCNSFGMLTSSSPKPFERPY